MRKPSTITDALREVVGRRGLITSQAKIKRFATGYRFGAGEAIAVVRPRSLVELWRVLKECVRADCIVIVQAANTGLTGGSTPSGDYDRNVVIVNTRHLTGLHLIDDGRQVVCLPGTTLYSLERALAPLGREPHSVIGSSCIGASVIGGICNNSGGALVRRGPAYTELALYADVDAAGEVRLHNHLGIDLGDDPEAVLAAVEVGEFTGRNIDRTAGAASDTRYCEHIRDIDADTPARFNADPSRLYEASGSAGRLVVFAVRLDTFCKDAATTTFYIGSNQPDELTILRRRILAECSVLPISAEYMHRGAFDIAARYGKDVFVAIRLLGTSRLPRLFAVKDWIDRVALSAKVIPVHLSDRLMLVASRLFPQHLPRRMLEFRDKYEHHLMIKTSGDGANELERLLGELFPSAAGGFFECTAEESEKAFLHRFATAGAAVRYRAVHADRVADIVAIDVALRRNDDDWFERLPDGLRTSISAALYYGHFLCHVLHQDYIVPKGVDPVSVEHRLLASLDERRAEYPAEHNVGHIYSAKPDLAAHYRALDPGNRLNPGIGKTSRTRGWAEHPNLSRSSQ